MLKMLGGGITGAGFPADNCLAGDAKEFGKPGLGQIALGAKREDLLTERIVALGVRRLAHGGWHPSRPFQRIELTSGDKSIVKCCRVTFTPASSILVYSGYAVVDPPWFKQPGECNVEFGLF